MKLINEQLDKKLFEGYDILCYYRYTCPHICLPLDIRLCHRLLAPLHFYLIQHPHLRPRPNFIFHPIRYLRLRFLRPFPIEENVNNQLDAIYISWQYGNSVYMLSYA